MSDDRDWLHVCSECGDPVLYQPEDAVTPRAMNGPPEGLYVDYIKRVAGHFRCLPNGMRGLSDAAFVVGAERVRVHSVPDESA